jgi:glycosyltransferase involved in cell wall biosynthesis
MPDAAVRVWDSLLMPLYLGTRHPDGVVRDIMLMHYLPSLNPLLDGAAAAEARNLEDRVAGRTAFFIATGRTLAETLRMRYPHHSVFLCEPGVDAVFSTLRHSLRPSESEDRGAQLLSVANLLPAKGYSELLAMLRRHAALAWTWHIVGSGEADHDFARGFLGAAEDLIETGRLIWHRVLPPDALAQLMTKMDMFLSASHFESYGMALAEAVAAGLPVLTTDVGAASILIYNGVNGYRVPPQAWAEYERCLRALLVDPMLRRSLRAAVSPPVRSWNETYADFESACRTVLAKGVR